MDQKEEKLKKALKEVELIQQGKLPKNKARDLIDKDKRGRIIKVLSDKVANRNDK